MVRVDGGPEEDGAGPSRSGKEPAANGDAGAEPRKPQKPQKPSTPSSGRLSDDQVFCIPHAALLPVPLNSLRPKRGLWWILIADHHYCYWMQVAELLPKVTASLLFKSFWWHGRR